MYVPTAKTLKDYRRDSRNRIDFGLDPKNFPSYADYYAAYRAEIANLDRIQDMVSRANTTLTCRKVKDRRPKYHRHLPSGHIGDVTILVGNPDLDLEIEVAVVAGGFQPAGGDGWDEPRYGACYEDVSAYVYRHGMWVEMELNEKQSEIVDEFAQEEAARSQREWENDCPEPDYDPPGYDYY